jgi:hypothetical protein
MTPCYNIGKQNPTSIVVLASLLILVIAVTSGIEPQEVTSQSTPQDPFQIGGIGTQNQTQTAPANLTRADMGPVTSALNSARDSLLGNGTLQDAYTSLSDADNALFRIAQSDPSATTTIINMSEPIRSHIERAQEALLDGDAPKALDRRNLAEVELLGIIQGLPAEDEEPSAEDEESPAEDEESSSEEEEEEE